MGSRFFTTEALVIGSMRYRRGRPHRHPLHPRSRAVGRDREGGAAHQVQGGRPSRALHPGPGEPALRARSLHHLRRGDAAHLPGRARRALPHGGGRPAAGCGAAPLSRRGGQLAGLQPAGPRGRATGRGSRRCHRGGRGAGRASEAPRPSGIRVRIRATAPSVEQTIRRTASPRRWGEWCARRVPWTAPRPASSISGGALATLRTLLEGPLAQVQSLDLDDRATAEVQQVLSQTLAYHGH